jgi:hypothetical protein
MPFIGYEIFVKGRILCRQAAIFRISAVLSSAVLGKVLQDFFRGEESSRYVQVRLEKLHSLQCRIATGRKEDGAKLELKRYTRKLGNLISDDPSLYGLEFEMGRERDPSHTKKTK